MFIYQNNLIYENYIYSILKFKNQIILKFGTGSNFNFTF